MRTFPLFLIPLIPLIGALLNLIVGKHLRKGTVSLIACGSMALTALAATQAVLSLIQGHTASISDQFFQADWIYVMGGSSAQIKAGLTLDALSSVLVLLISWVGLLIHMYSTGYMEQEPGYARFFGYLNLFSSFMLILVLGDSLPVTFVGWEGVGLCSYLLIGFWYQENKNASAGKKAFLVNRIGDFFFLLGMCLLFSLVGTLSYADFTVTLIQKLSQPLWFGWPAYYFIGLFLFIGCTGKSAQIPLYVWLPDAMAGPTPVSAFIHAATMVTAGIYVVVRMHGLFEVHPETAKMLITGIGGLTALFAATIGLFQKDLKKVLAYSTVSQLGFMFAAVGSGAYVAAMFHLLTHAFFKAGLFLGAGSVMHAMHGEGDVSKMGGLRKHLPITHITFFIYCLAITGIFPFSGFFSKDAILAEVFQGHFQIASTASPWLVEFSAHTFPKIVWGMLILAALCTAIYMWRLYFLVFTGSFRGTEEQRQKLHESPISMTLPLLILAILATIGGLLHVPSLLVPKAIHLPDILGQWLHRFSNVHTPGSEEAIAHHERIEWLLLGIAAVVSLLGTAIAFLLYHGGFSKTAERLALTFQRIYRFVSNKYYVDEAYTFLFVRPLQALSKFLFRWVDRLVIDDGIVHGPAAITQGFSKAIRYVQNGQVQRYLGVLVLGVAGLWYAAQWNLVHLIELRKAADFRIVRIEEGKVTIAVNQGESPQRNFFYRVSFEPTDYIGNLPFSNETTFEHTFRAPNTSSPCQVIQTIVVEVCDAKEHGVCQRSDMLLFPEPHEAIVCMYHHQEETPRS